MADLILPYHGHVRLTSKFGYRTLNGVYEWHGGIDLVGVDSMFILAPCNGIVVTSTIIEDKTNRTWEWGNYVRIDRDDGLQIYLCHMADRTVEAGQRIERGEVIGFEGSSGYAFGQHCHFEVRRNGVAINPAPLLGIQNELGIYQNPTTGSNNGTPGDGNVPHDWAKEEVEWCIDRKILRGDEDGYRLNDMITREEMCIMLYRLSHL